MLDWMENISLLTAIPSLDRTMSARNLVSQLCFFVGGSPSNEAEISPADLRLCFALLPRTVAGIAAQRERQEVSLTTTRPHNFCFCLHFALFDA